MLLSNKLFLSSQFKEAIQLVYLTFEFFLKDQFRKQASYLINRYLKILCQKAELDTLKDAVGKVMTETEVNSKLVRACVERTDQTVMAKAETDKSVETLRAELASQNRGLGEAQNLVRALLGAQKSKIQPLQRLHHVVLLQNDRTMQPQLG